MKSLKRLQNLFDDNIVQHHHVAWAAWQALATYPSYNPACISGWKPPQTFTSLRRIDLLYETICCVDRCFLWHFHDDDIILIPACQVCFVSVLSCSITACLAIQYCKTFAGWSHVCFTRQFTYYSTSRSTVVRYTPTGGQCTVCHT